MERRPYKPKPMGMIKSPFGKPHRPQPKQRVFDGRQPKPNTNHIHKLQGNEIQTPVTRLRNENRELKDKVKYLERQLNGNNGKLEQDNNKLRNQLNDKEEYIQRLKQDKADLIHDLDTRPEPIPPQHFGKTLVETLMKKAENENGEMICYICGRPVSYSQGEIDHIIPRNVSRAAIYDIENLAFVHKQCNSFKSDRPLSEVLKQKNNYR